MPEYVCVGCDAEYDNEWARLDCEQSHIMEALVAAGLSIPFVCTRKAEEEQE